MLWRTQTQKLQIENYLWASISAKNKKEYFKLVITSKIC